MTFCCFMTGGPVPGSSRSLLKVCNQDSPAHFTVTSSGLFAQPLKKRHSWLNGAGETKSVACPFNCMSVSLRYQGKSCLLTVPGPNSLRVLKARLEENIQLDESLLDSSASDSVCVLTWSLG